MGFEKIVAPDHPCDTPEITDHLGDNTIWACDVCGKRYTLMTSGSLVEYPSPRNWIHIPPLRLKQDAGYIPPRQPTFWDRLFGGAT